MKITVIHGQIRKGNTYHLTHKFLKHFKDSEITEFFLPKDLNHFCTGCFRCIENEQNCPFYDEKNKIMQSILVSDLIVFSTPTYCLRASAPMKSFIDLTFNYWMVHKPRKEMFYKKTVIFSTCAGTGFKSAIKDIKTAVSYWGISIIFTYGISVQAMNWDKVSDKKKVKIEKDMIKLSSKVLNTKTKVSLKTKIIFNVMRMMQKNGLGSDPSEKEYWKNQGWLNKNRPWK